MAHTKAGGSTRQKGNRRGKRLGVKLFGGEEIKSGQIIVRQKGNKFHAGDNVGTGKDFTLFALKDGLLKFFRRRDRQFITVK